MAPRHNSTPCFVSPHPDALARARLQVLRSQRSSRSSSGSSSRSSIATISTANSVNTDTNDALEKAKRFLATERQMPGLNDGTIFPKSHFDESVSLMAMGSAALERTPLRNVIRVFIVLVNFQDVKMAPDTKQRMEDLWFSTGGKVPTGSVTEFYSEVSNGAVELKGEVVGPFTLSREMGFYGAGNYGRGWPEPNSQTMANEAVDAAIGSTNFKQYDNDGNGYVDAFVVVHAGRAAEETMNGRDIWSVKWTLPAERSVDDVKIYGFLTVPEDAKCGVCAHEIGHLVFGWPDLYDIDSSSAGIGNWCLMSSGSWGGGGDRPVHPSAWCKASQNWITTITETENHTITLRDVKTDFKTHRLWTADSPTSTEYFLVENRQQTASDTFLPGSGLLVWHIDDSVFSNADENHPRVKLIQADGLDELKANIGRGDAGDPFPGYSHNTAFTDASAPSSKSYAGESTHVSITAIPLPAETMSFDITVRPTAPQTFDPRTWYRLKNTYEPATHCLDVINDAGTASTGLLQMAADGRYTGQHWQFVPNPDGTYFLRTLFLGPDRRLDVRPGDKGTPVLASAAPATAQYWKVEPWGDGTWRIENLALGKWICLDTMEGGRTVGLNARNEGRPTQRWRVEAIREIYEEGF